MGVERERERERERGKERERRGYNLRQGKSTGRAAQQSFVV